MDRRSPPDGRGVDPVRSRMTAGRGPEDGASNGPEARRGLDPEAHVLVVEDDAPMRHLIARLLRENGFRATGARDGREMWEALEKTGADLVLLDVMLPGQSGFDLLRALRARPDTPPVVMVTAKGAEAVPTCGRRLRCRPLAPGGALPGDRHDTTCPQGRGAG